MRPPSPSIPEKKFLYDALKQSLRLDGRDMLDLRTPTFTFGPELGWVECAMGKTRWAFIRIRAFYQVQDRRQCNCTIRRQNGQTATRTTLWRHYYNTFWNLSYGISRLWTWSVGACHLRIFYFLPWSKILPGLQKKRSPLPACWIRSSEEVTLLTKNLCAYWQVSE